MEIQTAPRRPRLWQVDALRGLALFHMLVYHGMYDWVYIFGHGSGWYNIGAPGCHAWQQYICWSFVLLSGFSFAMARKPWKNGLLVGTFNFLGFILQAIGAIYTTPSNSSFLTTTNVVMVPFLAWALYKVRPKMRNLLAVVVCMCGMAVLTGALNTRFVLNIGDRYTIAGAFFFAMSIVLLAKQPAGGHFARGAFLLGFTLFAGSRIYAFAIEGVNIAACDWNRAIWPILYLAVGSNFVAQSLQIIAQKHLSASTASLVMMLEGVFGSAFSIMFGYENFTLNLLVGGALILCSLVLSEIQIVKKKKL